MSVHVYSASTGGIVIAESYSHRQRHRTRAKKITTYISSKKQEKTHEKTKTFDLSPGDVNANKSITDKYF